MGARCRGAGPNNSSEPTDNLEDAVNTAVEMARKRELSGWPTPDPHCGQSSC